MENSFWHVHEVSVLGPCPFPRSIGHCNLLVSDQARLSPTLYRIKNKKGESLEDFDHVLDMVGRGLELFDHTSKY